MKAVAIVGLDQVFPATLCVLNWNGDGYLKGCNESICTDKGFAKERGLECRHGDEAVTFWRWFAEHHEAHRIAQLAGLIEGPVEVAWSDEV